MHVLIVDGVFGTKMHRFCIVHVGYDEREREGESEENVAESAHRYGNRVVVGKWTKEDAKAIVFRLYERIQVKYIEYVYAFIG